MSDKSGIEWTDATWNPVTGCTKVSPGCDHCYAETFAERFRGVPGHAYEQGFDLKLWPSRLEQPLLWSKPRRIFVNSMSDLFHKGVPDAFILDVFNTMFFSDQHQFQVLTKRPERMRRLVPAIYKKLAETLREDKMPMLHVWLGTSIESADYAWRADMLRQTPAAIRFLSCEPLLGSLNAVSLEGIDWVICGGESGPGARPMHQVWALELRDRCGEAGIPFFFKQWGEYKPLGSLGNLIPLTLSNKRSVVFYDGQHFKDTHQPPDQWPSKERWLTGRGEMVERVGKKNAGRELGGREWNEFPKAGVLA